MTNSKDAQTDMEVDLTQNSTGLEEEYLCTAADPSSWPPPRSNPSRNSVLCVCDRLRLVLLGVNIAQFILTSVECQTSPSAAAGRLRHSSVPRFAVWADKLVNHSQPGTDNPVAAIAAPPQPGSPASPHRGTGASAGLCRRFAPKAEGWRAAGSSYRPACAYGAGAPERLPGELLVAGTGTTRTRWSSHDVQNSPPSESLLF